MLTIIPNVVRRRTVDPAKLGWLDGKRAETRSNFPANRDYVDLRGLSAADLDAVIAEERAGFAALQAAGYDDAAVAEVDRARRAAAVAPMLDFGIAAAVVALSALGCVPVTSCRGRSLGAHGHAFPAPMATFYARRAHLPALMRAIEAADIYVVNNSGKLEIYSDDVRRMLAFAETLRAEIGG